jgi:ataxia telangiectasia mutated family protein
MVGYVLGIGDRHGQNILLDESTAEMVHIDFGVAFDQGKLLKCPEVVPFRLTRDIIDGMGVTQCEGVFRRCCEETLKVLRRDEEMVLTVLEVLKRDPLYTWALSATKKGRLRPEMVRRTLSSCCYPHSCSLLDTCYDCLTGDH